MRYIVYICFVLTLASCMGSTQIVSTETMGINVAFNSVADTTVFSSDCSKFMLDENAVIGDADRIFAVGDTLFVLNGQRNEIVMIDTNGRLINKINKQGRGHGEYIQLIDFAIDYHDSTIVCLCAPLSFCVYDYNGNFVSKTELDTYYSEIAADASFLYFLRISGTGKDANKFAIDAIEKGTNKVRHLLPTIKDNAPMCSIGRQLFSNGEECVFVRKFDRNVYRLSDGDVDVRCSFMPDGLTLEAKNDGSVYKCQELFEKCMKERKLYAFSNVVGGADFSLMSTNVWDIIVRKGQVCTRYPHMQNTDLGIPLRMFRPIEGQSDYAVAFISHESEFEGLAEKVRADENMKKRMNPRLVKFLEEMQTFNRPILFLYKNK